MTKNVKTICIVLTKILLTATAFYVISRRITVNPFTYLNQSSIEYFLLAGLLSLALIFLQALRWKHIVKIFSVNLSFKQCLVAVWSGHLVNNLLPAATAGDLLRSYTLRYADNNKWKWLGAFVSEKYSAATSALLLACIALMTSIAHSVPTVLIGFIASLFLGLIMTPLIMIKLSPHLKLPEIKLIIFIRKMTLQLANTVLNKNGRYAFINSLFINLSMCITFYIIAIGLGVPLQFEQCLFVVPVFTILASFPISYAGWGVRELSCVTLLQFFHVPTETAMIVSVMYGLVFLLSCLPGIFVFYSFLATRYRYKNDIYLDNANSSVNA